MKTARSFGVPEAARIPTTVKRSPCPAPSGSPCATEIFSPTRTPSSRATVAPTTASKYPFSSLCSWKFRPSRNAYVRSPRSPKWSCVEHDGSSGDDAERTEVVAQPDRHDQLGELRESPVPLIVQLTAVGGVECQPLDPVVHGRRKSALGARGQRLQFQEGGALGVGRRLKRLGAFRVALRRGRNSR